MKQSYQRRAVAVTALFFGLTPLESLAEQCDLALVLALDVSKSMDTTEFTLQIEGTAAALNDPSVQSAILNQGSHVAITAFEWSGETHQVLVDDWTMLRTRQDIEDFASSVLMHARGGRGKHTGTGTALEFAYQQLERGPACLRSVIDVSSDGYNNDGMSPEEFYASVPFDAFTVNALVVGGKSRPILWRYFETEVAYGPGAFSIATTSFADYAEAIKEKLLREILPPIHIARPINLRF